MFDQFVQYIPMAAMIDCLEERSKQYPMPSAESLIRQATEAAGAERALSVAHTEDGRRYFLDVHHRRTYWNDPRAFGMPPEWDVLVSASGDLRYAHIPSGNTYDSPPRDSIGLDLLIAEQRKRHVPFDQVLQAVTADASERTCPMACTKARCGLR